MKWNWWSWLPGLNWIAWVHAAMLTRQPQYLILGLIYALPLVLLLGRRPSIRIVLISWAVGLVHVMLHKQRVDHQIEQRHPAALVDEAIRQALLRAALKHGGRLTVTQGVMEIGASFEEVERVLQAMVESGYVFYRNHPTTGVVEYVFKEVL